MNDKYKYGIIAVTGWNIFVILLMAIASFARDIPFGTVFDGRLDGIVRPIFLIIWSLCWFGIGYTSRKKYLSGKAFYREEAPLLTEEQFNKAYRRYYISKNAKIISIVLMAGIPWYILGHVRGDFCLTDWIIIAVMFVASIFAFAFYKRLY
jgi:hypothetical protein